MGPATSHPICPAKEAKVCEFGGREISRSWGRRHGVRVEIYCEEERRVSAPDRRHSSSPGKRCRRRRPATMAVIPRQRDPASRSSSIPWRRRPPRHPCRSPPPCAITAKKSLRLPRTTRAPKPRVLHVQGQRGGAGVVLLPLPPEITTASVLRPCTHIGCDTRGRQQRCGAPWRGRPQKGAAARLGLADLGGSGQREQLGRAWGWDAARGSHEDRPTSRSLGEGGSATATSGQEIFVAWFLIWKERD